MKPKPKGLRHQTFCVWALRAQMPTGMTIRPLDVVGDVPNCIVIFGGTEKGDRGPEIVI